MPQKKIEVQTIARSLDWVHALKLQPENEAVANLLKDVRPYDSDLEAIQANAAELVEKFRANPKLKSLLDAFLQEYGLSNNEGIALMCLTRRHGMI